MERNSIQERYDEAKVAHEQLRDHFKVETEKLREQLLQMQADRESSQTECSALKAERDFLIGELADSKVAQEQLRKDFCGDREDFAAERTKLIERQLAMQATRDDLMKELLEVKAERDDVKRSLIDMEA